MSYGFSQELVADLRRQLSDAQQLGAESVGAAGGAR